jgi:hypothetical protein
MSGRARGKVRRPSAGAAVSYAGEFLERLAHILVHAGHSPEQLAREFREICSKLPEPSGRWDPKQLGYLADLPHVLAHWHADPQYLDSRGAPSALPLRAGRGPSLRTLINRVLPSEDPSAVAESLTRMRGIRRRRGLYLPTGRYLTFPRASARVHGLAALLGMLRTVEHNVSGSKTMALLERVAMNPSFPVSALPAFHRRVKASATEFLWNFDSDMRRQEAKNLPGPRVRLGVGVFAFEEPMTGERGGRRRRARAIGAGRRARKGA